MNQFPMDFLFFTTIYGSADVPSVLALYTPFPLHMRLPDDLCQADVPASPDRA